NRFLKHNQKKRGREMELTAIKPGMKNETEEMVTEDKTAMVMGSGSLPVYATPAMCCLMEKAAAELAEKLLPEDWTTVGGSLAIQHKAPTPVGNKVRAEAEVLEVAGRRIAYKVTAYDEAGLIGEGSHERFAVGREKFMEKAAQRR
ncbi:MAG: thioesterase family protein, partial [Victivallales bacterium]|nr:thioesterase family protein [Victivallales bacterium]